MVKYVEFNANPFNRKVCDCVTRAISMFLDISYDTAYIELFNISLSNGYPVKQDKVYKPLMKKYGYEYKSIKHIKGNPRITVKEFLENNANTAYILRCRGHLVYCNDGNYYDTWDCGNMGVFGYYEKR